MKHTKAIARTLSLLLTMGMLLGGLMPAAQAAGFAAIVTAASGMRVYTDSAMSRSAGTLPQGEVVTVNGYFGATAAITYKERDGYAAIADMARVSDTCKKAKVKVSNAYAYEKQDLSSRSVALKKGYTVYLVDVAGKWARIAAGSHVGYTNIDWLTVLDDAAATPAPATTQTTQASQWIPAVVAADSVKVYVSPSTISQVMTTVKKGTALNVVDYTKNWAHVEKNGYYGYCPTSALKKADNAVQPTPTSTPSTVPTQAGFTATVTAESVRVYAAEGTESKYLGTLKRGVQVRVLDYGPAWAHIELNGHTGYCAIIALTRDAAATPTPTAGTKDPIPATVTADSAKVYASASTSSEVLGTLKKGAQVNVVDANSNWAFIELNGRYGFCPRAALTRSSDLLPTIPPSMKVKFTATVIAPNTPVYERKSTDAKSVSLALGSTVDVYAYDDNWALVSKGDVRGFTPVKYLNGEAYDELNTGASGDAVLNLQKTLETLGYFDGVPGGNYSTMTTDAVKRFQSAVGLFQTGVADQLTLRILAGGYAPSSPLLSASLSKGSTGANVTRLQTRLLSKGYLSKSGSVDGDYGSITVSAVKLFQKKAGLSETGEADSETLRELYKSSAPSLGSGTPADASVTPVETPSTDKTTPVDAGDTPGSNSKIETVITAAKNQLGKPYVYGAMGMSSFDCSGLTCYAFKQVGITLNRTAYAQGYNDGTKISGLSNLVRGDIVCMDTIRDSDLCDHVGIYLGGGQMIHASSGSGKVIISSLTSGYYNRVFSWGRRIIQ